MIPDSDTKLEQRLQTVSEAERLQAVSSAYDQAVARAEEEDGVSDKETRQLAILRKRLEKILDQTGNPITASQAATFIVQAEKVAPGVLLNTPIPAPSAPIESWVRSEPER